MNSEEQPLIVFESSGMAWNIPAFLQATDHHVCQSLIDASLRHTKPEVHESMLASQGFLRHVFDDRIGLPYQSIHNLGFTFVCRVRPLPSFAALPKYLVDGAMERVLADERMMKDLREVREGYRTDFAAIPGRAAAAGAKVGLASGALFTLGGVMGFGSAIVCAAIGAPVSVASGVATYYLMRDNWRMGLEIGTGQRLSSLYFQTSPHLVESWIAAAGDIQDRQITISTPMGGRQAFARGGNVGKEYQRRMIDQAIEFECRQKTGRLPFTVLLQTGQRGEVSFLEIGAVKLDAAPKPPGGRDGGRGPRGQHPLWDWVPKPGREQPAGAA